MLLFYILDDRWRPAPLAFGEISEPVQVHAGLEGLVFREDTTDITGGAFAEPLFVNSGSGSASGSR